MQRSRRAAGPRACGAHPAAEHSDTAPGRRTPSRKTHHTSTPAPPRQRLSRRLAGPGGSCAAAAAATVLGLPLAAEAGPGGAGGSLATICQFKFCAGAPEWPRPSAQMPQQPLLPAAASSRRVFSSPLTAAHPAHRARAQAQAAAARQSSGGRSAAAASRFPQVRVSRTAARGGAVPCGGAS